MSLKLKKAPPNTTGQADSDAVAATVSAVIADIRDRGDAAVREYSARFDNWPPDRFRLAAEDIERIVATVPAQTVQDIKTVQANVRGFAEKQLASMLEFEVETAPGVFLGQKHNPVDAVGAYEILLLVGVQAVAAMAVGTESIGKVGIDLFAGPTEVLIIADPTADPLLAAVDRLSQAEHGPDSPAILITTSESVRASRVRGELPAWAQ
jgi:sulfopropanediol 3-dehydrogenase